MKCSLLLADFNQNWHGSIIFRKKHQCQLSWKSVHTDGQSYFKMCSAGMQTHLNRQVYIQLEDHLDDLAFITVEYTYKFFQKFWRPFQSQLSRLNVYYTKANMLFAFAPTVGKLMGSDNRVTVNYLIYTTSRIVHCLFSCDGLFWEICFLTNCQRIVVY